MARDRSRSRERQRQAAAERQVDRAVLDAGVEAPGRRSDVDTVRRLAMERAGLQLRLDEVIRRARAGGATWQELGQALGVTPQAVQKRYGR